MKIMLIGTFDVNNYGDCLFPDIIKCELTKRLGPLEIDLYSPTSRVARIGNYSAVHQLPGDHNKDFAMSEYDAAVMAGGEILTYGHTIDGIYSLLPKRKFSSGLRLWLVPAIACTRSQKAFIINAAGVGYLDDQISPAMSMALEIADYHCVRGRFSLEKLKDIGCHSNIGTDCAFAVSDLKSVGDWISSARDLLPEGISPGKYIVVQASLRHVKNRFSQWCDSIRSLQKKARSNIVFLPICYHHSDRILLKKAQNYLNQSGTSAYLINKYLKTTETAAVIGSSSGYYGTSLHGSITAISFEKPLAVLVSSERSKQEEVLNTVGLNESVTSQLGGIAQCFFNTSASQRESAALKGKRQVAIAFDEITEILTDPKPYRPVSSVGEILIKALEADKSTAPKTAKDHIKKWIFTLIRFRPVLNEFYDNLYGELRHRYG